MMDFYELEDINKAIENNEYPRIHRPFTIHRKIGTHKYRWVESENFTGQYELQRYYGGIQWTTIAPWKKDKMSESLMTAYLMT